MKQIAYQTFIPRQSPANIQAGISLLFTVVLLLALTVIAITVTTSNQTQSILVRNNQFRLEAFNASYTEIDAQIDAINQRALSAGPPTYVDVLISGEFNQRIEAGDNELALLSTAASAGQLSEPDDAGNDTSGPSNNVEVAGVARAISQVYRGPCQIFGEEASVNAASVVCNEIRIDSDTQLANTSVGSMQRQVYEYRSLGGE